LTLTVTPWHVVGALQDSETPPGMAIVHVPVGTVMFRLDRLFTLKLQFPQLTVSLLVAVALAL
jgi:hypothetical protein